MGRELSDAGCTIRDKDAVIRQLQQELQEAQGMNFSAQNDQVGAQNPDGVAVSTKVKEPPGHSIFDAG